MSELINQGGFGCIFYPGFNCKGEENKTKNTVTKLQADSFNAHNEIYIGSIIKKIVNYNLFFLPVIFSCSINVALLNKQYIDKCKIISDKNSEYILLELPYLKNISFKKLFSDSLRSTKHLFLTYIETFQYLVISIEYLIKNFIVQFDLKEDNILYSIKYENPILIDFGISIPINKLTTANLQEYFYVYAPDYYICPLEVHAINFLVNVNDRLLLKDIENLAEIYVTNNSALFIFSDEFKHNYKLMCINFLKKYENMNKDIVIEELLKHYKTWDIYALSILYLKFYSILFKNGFFESKFIINFAQLLLLNISPDPNKRLESSEILQKYKDIFFINEKPENYLTLINNLKF